MTKEQAIIKAKDFRLAADTLLQGMKYHRKELMNIAYLAPETPGGKAPTSDFADYSEVLAQHIIAMRDLESCIMRQGMVLKAIGNPTPYPNSYNPGNTVVDPTADGLTM